MYITHLEFIFYGYNKNKNIKNYVDTIFLYKNKQTLFSILNFYTNEMTSLSSSCFRLINISRFKSSISFSCFACALLSSFSICHICLLINSSRSSNKSSIFLVLFSLAALFGVNTGCFFDFNSPGDQLFQVWEADVCFFSGFS